MTLPVSNNNTVLTKLIAEIPERASIAKNEVFWDEKHKQSDNRVGFKMNPEVIQTYLEEKTHSRC